VKQAPPNQRSPWQLQCPLVSPPPSDNKNADVRLLASVTTTLASREHRSSESTSSCTAADSASDHQCSSGQPTTAGASPARRPRLHYHRLARYCKRFIRHPAGSQSSGCCKDERRHKCWIARSNESFAWHPAGSPACDKRPY
jgi:hypothetical protein